MSDFFLNIILFIYHNLTFQNLGVTIVFIAVLSRVILYPFTKHQYEYGKKMRKIQPEVDALKKKHKDNKQALASAQMELFKKHNVNPAAGCLPSILPLIILFGLLGAMNKILNMDISKDFLIWNLAKPDAYKVNFLPIQIPGLLVFLAAATQFILSKMMIPIAPPVHKEDKPKEVKEKTSFASEFASAQSSMIWMFPLMFLFFGTVWPSGLALYWATSSALAIVQQYRIDGWGSLFPKKNHS